MIGVIKPTTGANADRGRKTLLLIVPENQLQTATGL
jgi:hypothetical protein